MTTTSLRVEGTKLELLPARTEKQESPDWVRISMASALALRYRSGRFTRDFDFGGINLLLNYSSGCRSDCSYCGLARTRPGMYEDKSFIRVEWPLVELNDLINRMAEHHGTLTRLCISMVTHGRAYADTAEIIRRIRTKVDAPLSILVAPPTLSRERLTTFKDFGADMIGIGLDAVTEDLFRRHRSNVPSGGGLSWDQYWEIVAIAREIYGPWKVNCHTLVGLGETDKEAIGMFIRLCDQEIYPYLFCFNPEEDSRMGEQPKSPIRRWRRIQLAKHLVEFNSYRWDKFTFDDQGALTGIVEPSNADQVVAAAVASGTPFETDGCPSDDGGPGCTRPYGSYGPAESFRDFPFAPTSGDLATITQEMALDEILTNR
ncbi:MAG: radical SAM protein [Actinomycetota bacterium]|nr:radical SAM protein [Actinomycetota bacterium]